MKKIFFSILATILLSGVAVHAGDVKAKKGKHVAKTAQCGKDCPPTTNCHPANCPTKPGCVCK